MSSLAFQHHPSQAYTIEELADESLRLNLNPTRPTIRRVRRAVELAQTGAVSFAKHADEGRIYRVHSQTTDEIYTVTAPSVDLPVTVGECYCTCPDSNVKQNICKHSIAVVMFEEFERDRAEIARNEDARHLVDPEISHLLPDSYERLLMAQQ